MPAPLLVCPLLLTEHLPVPCPQEALLSVQAQWTHPSCGLRGSLSLNPSAAGRHKPAYRRLSFCMWAARTESLMRDCGCNQTHVISQTWKQTEEPSQSGWKAPAGSRPAGEAAKWYKLMKRTLAEPPRLPPPPQSGSSNSLPGGFTPGGQELVWRTNREKAEGGR